jgi:hypothetical protein
MKQLLHRFLESEQAHAAKLITKRIISPDYYMYLYEVGSAKELYVLVEIDYFGGLDVAKDIEDAFSVQVVGWCPLRKKDEGHGELIPANQFNTVATGKDLADSEWDIHQQVVEHTGFNFMLARVDRDKAFK